MTTIAYRNGILASDRQVSEGDSYFAQTKKIFKDSYGNVIGVCGKLHDLRKAEVWMMEEGDDNGDSAPIPFSSFSEDFEALYITQYGKVMLMTNTGVTDVEGDFFAIGSGWRFAAGAMAAGATAMKAIKIASYFDAHTGGGIDMMEIGH